MINRVVLVGRLTKDPELRYTPTGIAVCRFILAVNRTFTNQSGEREADFIGCIAWRKQAENLANFMKKGNLVGIDGRIQTGNFEGQDGKRVYTTDIVADNIQFLEKREQHFPEPPPERGFNPQQTYSAPPNNNQNHNSYSQSSKPRYNPDDPPF